MNRSSSSPFNAPRQNACVSYHLQDLKASAVEDFSVGVSHILPGGGTESDASPVEKIYVVLSGEITLEAGAAPVTLKPFDSCVIGKNEERLTVNESHHPPAMPAAISTHKVTP